MARQRDPGLGRRVDRHVGRGDAVRGDVVRPRRIPRRSLTTTIRSVAEPTADPTSRWSAADLLIAVALVVAAFVKRLPSLPYNGMFHDDAWQAASITLTTPREWLRTSIDHPLFVALLSPLRYLADTNPVALVVPVLIVGALVPAAVFVMLRSLRYSRSIATSLAAVFVVAPGPVAFSGHLKTYVADLVIVAVTATVLPKLASMRWTARGGVLWFCGAVLVGTFSVFVLVATALAGVVLVFAAGPDRRTRAIAVGSQLVVQLLYSRHVRTTYSVERLQHFWSSRNAFVRFAWNPVVFAGRLFRHFRRVVAIVPGPGRGWLTALVAIVVLVGLLLAARRRQAIAARFLLLLLVAAALAGTVKLLPFGPGPGTVSRAGVAVARPGGRGRTRGDAATSARARLRGNLRRAFDGAAYGFAILLIALSMGHTRTYATERHAFGGRLRRARSARLRPRGALRPQSSTPTPSRPGSRSTFGRIPARLREPRCGSGSRCFPSRRRDCGNVCANGCRTSRTVFTVEGIPRLHDAPPNAIVQQELLAAGFRPAYRPKFDDTQVVIWGRAPD